MGIAIGIDLGTTNSCVAVVQGNRAKVIADSANRRLHPSIVSFHPDGAILSGHEAKERQIIDAKNTIYSFKRLLGRDLNSEEMKRVIQEFPYEAFVGPDEIPAVKVHDREVSLPEVSAMMLRHLREMCEEVLGVKISEAVITVPANFNDVQRSSTKVAGRIAGLNVLRILNEPTAAALAYGFGGQRSERIAIYDFGGGTFDITIVELAEDIFEVLATSGDTYLGGDDFDKLVIDEICKEFKAEHKIDLNDDAVAMQRIRSVAEKVKCQLSTIDEVQATLREIIERPDGTPIDFHFRLTKERFEKIVEPFVDRSLKVCSEAFKLAGLDRSALDNLVLVGGTTRIPIVRKRVEEYFGKKPRMEINPDEVVAIGAAIQAFSLTGEQLPEDLPTPVRSKPMAGRGTGVAASRSSSNESLQLAPKAKPIVKGSTAFGLPKPVLQGGAPGSAGQKTMHGMPGALPSTAPTGFDDGMTGLDVKPVDADSWGLDVKRTGNDMDLDVKHEPDELGLVLKPEGDSEALGLDIKHGEPALGLDVKHDETALGLDVKNSATVLGLDVKTPDDFNIDLKRVDGAFGADDFEVDIKQNAEMVDLPGLRKEDSISDELPAVLEAPSQPFDQLPIAPQIPLIPSAAETEAFVKPEAALPAPILDPGKTEAFGSPQPAPPIAPPVLDAGNATDVFGSIPPAPPIAPTAVDTDIHDADPFDSPPLIDPGLPDLDVEDVAFEISPEITETAGIDSDAEFDIQIDPFAGGDDLPTEAPIDPFAGDEEMPMEIKADDLVEMETGEASFDEPEEFGLTDNSIDATETVPTTEFQDELPDDGGFGEIGKLPVPGTENDEVIGLGDSVEGSPGSDYSPEPEKEDFEVPVTAAIGTALLLDVTPRGLGIAVAGGFCDLIIERNAAIPVEQSRLFSTSIDNQKEVSIDVYQGESRKVAENTKLGQVQLSKIRSAPRGTIKIRVTFEIDTDGILGVSASNEETKEAQRTRIVLTGGMDDAKIEALVEKYADKK
jgi:molecular chaperone DnaK (HSP70)